MFRIGHLGDSNDLTLVATVAGVEMGLKLSGVKLAGSGVQATMDYFAAHPRPRRCRRRPERARTPAQSNTETPCNDVHSSRPPGAAAAALGAPALLAQEWPTGPVRIVVGFPPGGGTDALARVVGAEAVRDVEPARSSSRTRAASPACWRPSTWRRSRATAPRC